MSSRQAAHGGAPKARYGGGQPPDKQEPRTAQPEPRVAGRFLGKQVSAVMQERMASLTGTNRQLRRDLARHGRTEAALRKRSERFERLWNESRVLQKELRHLTHQMLQNQEGQRLTLSHELQNQIAQTLLGIHVRLQGLKQESRAANRTLAGGIAHTRRLMKTSARTLRRSTKALGLQ